MSTYFTPTDSDVKRVYVVAVRNSFIASTGDIEQEFDRWLAEHDRKIAAAAFDEGHSHCFHVEDPKNQRPYNPYLESE